MCTDCTTVFSNVPSLHKITHQSIIYVYTIASLFLSCKICRETQYCNNKALLKVLTLVKYIHVHYMKYSNRILSEHHYPHVWLWHCATSQKVMGSIPDGVTGISH